VGIDDDAALGYSLEEIGLAEATVRRDVEKFESLEEKGVNADLGRSLELYLLEEFAFEAE
jgi:hypothetical protein